MSVILTLALGFSANASATLPPTQNCGGPSPACAVSTGPVCGWVDNAEWVCSLTEAGTGSGGAILVEEKGLDLVAEGVTDAGSPFCCTTQHEGETVSLLGSPGADSITMASAPSWGLGLSVDGGEGDDRIEGAQSAPLGFTQELQGGLGHDEISAGVATSVLLGGGGDDVLVGSDLADEIDGGHGMDRIFGLGGWDSLYGGEGDDVIRGGMGDDHLYGEGGEDTLFGGGDKDTVRGGARDDILCEISGRLDVIDGGAGDDLLYYDADSVPRSATAGSGSDTCNTGAGSAWAADCESYTSEVPQACASEGIGATAMFYQYVDKEGTSNNETRSALTYDGITIEPADASWEEWVPLTAGSYGDPVHHFLDGTWRLGARTVDKEIYYLEDTCPTAGTPNTITSPAAPGATAFTPLLMGKLSRPFDYDGETYVLIGNAEGISMARITDTNTSLTAMDWSELYAYSASTPPSVPSDIPFGEAYTILEPGVGYSRTDVTIAQRDSGDWVLYVKAVEQKYLNSDNCLSPGCECEREIHRYTSSDLLTWTRDADFALTGVSVPQTYTDGSGRVWLYYMSFEDTCPDGEEDGSDVAEEEALDFTRGRPTAAWEDDDYVLSGGIALDFSHEDFHDDEDMHYATNPNPVSLFDEDALDSYLSCIP